MSASSQRLREAAITAACTLLSLAVRPWSRRRSRRGWPPPRRILVLRRCCLGDVLMTTPLLAALDETYPAAGITYATGPWSRAALGGNPRVDEVWTLPAGGGIAAWLATVRCLRRGRFDLAMLPERSPLVHLAAWLARIPRRVGLDSGGRGFALTDAVPTRGVRHEVERSLDLARALGIAVPPGPHRPEYLPAPASIARVDALLEERGVVPPLLVVHPGGGANPGAVMTSKRWPTERFGQLADALHARHGGSVVLVGAPDDRPCVDATRAAMETAALDVCGALSLDELGALCCRAALYIGNDSGATHLAEACGAPTVVVFGPTDPAMYGPVDGVGEAVWDAAACAPVVRRGDLTRGGDNARCIDAVTVADALAAAERVLARAAQAGRAARSRP